MGLNYQNTHPTFEGDRIILYQKYACNINIIALGLKITWLTCLTIINDN